MTLFTSTSFAGLVTEFELQPLLSNKVKKKTKKQKILVTLGIK